MGLTMTAKLCPRCGDDFGAWPDGDSEGVDGWDGQTYCSGECVVAAFRAAPAAEREAWREQVKARQ